MRTQLFTSPLSEEELNRAADIIRSGGLLGIPTETVYGLGANALDADACRRIYEAKGRPQDNPLIIHVADDSWLCRYCKDIPDAAYLLAKRFWPGPLTMILPKRDMVPYRTTGGLDTVGVRCPDHPLTLEIIRRADVPIAAPSGNTSGRPSPTTAEHMMEDMMGKIDGIVDGGACGVGVESTIIDLTVTPPRLLRPGGLPLEALQEALGTVEVDRAVTAEPKKGVKPKAPGMAYRHYAPVAPVTVIAGNGKESAEYIRSHLGAKSGVICFHEYASLFPGHIVRDLGPEHDKAEQARRVFDAMRSFDGTDVTDILAQCPDGEGLGFAVENRLKKAAGFHVVELPRRKIIGITGGTGCGKTTALSVLQQMGVRLIDCDRVYADLLEREPALVKAIGEVFPGTVEQGKLRRSALGKQVFSDREKLELLNQTAWPFVVEAVKGILEQTAPQSCAIDAVGLFESGLAALCTVTVAVTAPEQARIARLVERDGISEGYAALRIHAQKKNEEFAKQCNEILHNDFDTLEAFSAYCEKRWKEILQ